MKTLIRFSLVAALFGVSAFAQTATPSTTLCAAITSTQATTICLTSITNVVGQTQVFVDGELMQVVRTPTTTTAVTVVRNYGASGGGALHASGTKAWIGLTPDKSVVPGVNGFVSNASASAPSGTCTRTSITYLPLIYVNTGQKYDCDGTTSVWRPYLSTGTVQYVTDAGANNAITSPVGSTPAYLGMMVSVTLAHSLQAGANTFAYAGGSALSIKSARNPANDIGTAYVSTGVVTLRLALISTTQTWLDISQ